MIYIAAFDGGGTKTRCIIGDETGHILADHCIGASNHQTVGFDGTKNILVELFEKSLKTAGIKAQDISMAYLGLSGADMEPDFIMLNKLCSEIFGPIPYRVVNDTWIAMRSGLKGNWGAVAICGTGANSAVIHPDGRRVILRALSYMLGGYGGGSDLAITALHHAFRADEGTGRTTLLTKFLPQTFGANDMEGLLKLLYPENKLGIEDLGKITPLIFELANKGDAVCQDLLSDMGGEMGEILGGLISRLEMENMEIPVVIGGNVFKGSGPILIDSFCCSLHKTAPYAFLVHSKFPPVAGAYLSAMDEMKVESIVGLGTKITLVKTIKKQEEQEEESISSLTKE